MVNTKTQYVASRVLTRGALAYSFLAVPSFALAANAVKTEWFTSVLNGLKTIVEGLVPLLIGIALVVFIWGVIEFILGGETAKKEGKGKMLWGIVGLFVIVSIWGIVKLVRTIAGVGEDSTITAPPVPS